METRPRAWLSATLALETETWGPSASSQLGPWLTHELSLTKRGSHGEPDVRVPFVLETPGWIHVPKGYLLTAGGRALLPPESIEVVDRRSSGRPLPSIKPGPGIVWGAPPFPPGQAQFIADMVQGARANKHGGLAVAPTRSGKTLCALAAAIELGGSTLILVDQTNLLEQWAAAVRCFVDVNGQPVSPSIIKQGEMDLSSPFVIGMVQTLAGRSLTEDVRRAFRTVIVDECQSIPTDTAWAALQRFEATYVLGLTATPDRKDGLTAAISWLIGPEIAKLERTLEADVQFQHIPYVGLVPKVRRNGEPYMGKARISFYGQTDAIQVEKALMEDAGRVSCIASAAVDGLRAGRQVLVMCGMKEHVRRLNATLQSWGHGASVGLYYGDSPDRRNMESPIVITTYKMSAKGTDFQPPPTLFIPAAPVSDIRQAAGRALQPQVPHKTLIWDPVDGHPALVKWARARASYYHEKRFNFLNEVCPAGWPPADKRIDMEEVA